MLYQSVSAPYEKSSFRRSFSLQARRQRWSDMSGCRKQLNFCCLVLQYSLAIRENRHYQLLCVNGKMSLKVLQEYIVRRSKQGTVRPALLFEVRGRIQNPGENIGRLSEKCSEEDGFLYIFVRSQNTF